MLSIRSIRSICQMEKFTIDSTSRSNSLWGQYYVLRRYYLSLANKMQQSNGKLVDSIEYNNSPFDESIESIESTKVCGLYYNGDII